MSEKEENKEQNDISTEIAVIDENTIRDKIYDVRGVQVMLDFELAEIYGYTTSAFNQQVKRNEDRFPADFRFQLTQDEIEDLSKSQNVILNRGTGRGSNVKYLPWAFTEQGIYMLMTILKGDVAVVQSIALIRTFKGMKDYIVQNQGLIEQHNYLRLSIQMTEMQKELSTVRNNLQTYGTLVLDHDQKLIDVMEQLNDTVRKSEISPIMLDFNKQEVQREYVFLKGQPMKADAAYIKIYSEAKRTVHLVDDYIGSKTLHLLQDVQPGVTVTVFSDNRYNKLSLGDFQDFQQDFPNIQIDFIQTLNKVHDRFIVLDYGTANERIFHCGASSKDAGKRIMAITEFAEGTAKDMIHDVIKGMLTNPQLMLN